MVQKDIFFQIQNIEHFQMFLSQIKVNVLMFFFGLILLPFLSTSAENSTDLNSIEVCATKDNVNKTFANIWQLYDDYKTTGQLWIPVSAGACPVKNIDCTLFSPVCAVTNDNFFKSFPNQCILEAEQNTTGIAWKIVFNGICSANPGDGFLPSSESSNSPNNEQNKALQQPLYSSTAASESSSSDSSSKSGSYSRPSDDKLPLAGSGKYNPPQVQQPAYHYNPDSVTTNHIMVLAPPHNASLSSPGEYSKAPSQSPAMISPKQSYSSPSINSGHYQLAQESSSTISPPSQPCSSPSYGTAYSLGIGKYNTDQKPQTSGNYITDYAPGRAETAPSSQTAASSVDSGQYEVAKHLPAFGDYNHGLPPSRAVSVPSQLYSSLSYNAATGKHNSVQESNSSGNYNQAESPHYKPPVGSGKYDRVKEPPTPGANNYGVAPAPSQSSYKDSPLPIYEPYNSAQEGWPSNNLHKDLVPGRAVSDPTRTYSTSTYNAASLPLSGQYNSPPVPQPSYSYNHGSAPDKYISSPSQLPYRGASSLDSGAHEPPQEQRYSSNYNNSSAQTPTVSAPSRPCSAPSHNVVISPDLAQESQPSEGYNQNSASTPLASAPSQQKSAGSNRAPTSNSEPQKQTTHIYSPQHISFYYVQHSTETPAISAPLLPAISSNLYEYSSYSAGNLSPGQDKQNAAQSSTYSASSKPTPDKNYQYYSQKQAEAATLPPNSAYKASPSPGYYNEHSRPYDSLSGSESDAQRNADQLASDKPDAIYSQHKIVENCPQSAAINSGDSKQSYSSLAGGYRQQANKYKPTGYSSSEPSNNTDQSASDAVPYSGANENLPSDSQISNDTSITSDNYFDKQNSSCGSIANTNLSNASEYDSNTNNLKTYNDADESIPNNDGQIIYNGVVYQGPYYYEPKYRHINFGDFNFLPTQNSARTALADTRDNAATTSEANTLEDLLKHLQYIASLKYNNN